jgi:hypothetical protein
VRPESGKMLLFKGKENLKSFAMTRSLMNHGDKEIWMQNRPIMVTTYQMILRMCLFTSTHLVAVRTKR